MGVFNKFWAALADYRVLYMASGMAVTAGVVHIYNQKWVLAALVTLQAVILLSLAQRETPNEKAADAPAEGEDEGRQVVIALRMAFNS